MKNDRLVSVKSFPRTAVMRPHMGKTFLDVANEYPSLLLAVFEAVQNAIDAGATKIVLTVSLISRFISVQDNGSGRTVAEFNEALTHINQTVKNSDKLGRFGKGLIAFLGKCSHFTFTSGVAGDSYREWTFRTRDIVNSYEPPVIPIRNRNDLAFTPKPGERLSRGVSPVSWRTELAVYQYTQDKELSRLSAEEIEKGILVRYAKAMRKHGVTIVLSFTNAEKRSVNRLIKATQFKGSPLKRHEEFDADAGTVTFRLFRVKKGDPGLGVFVGEAGNDFTVPWENFWAQTRAPRSPFTLKGALHELFMSGAFEGEILVERIELHPERTKFVVNDAFVGFGAALDSWYNQFGDALHSELRSLQDEDRFKAAALRSVDMLKHLAGADGGYAPFEQFLSKAQIGTTGIGHASIRATTTGRETERATALAGGVGKERPEREKGQGSNWGGKNPREDHRPYVAIGDGGTPRQEVRGHSIGVHVTSEVFDDDNTMFRTDIRRGLVVVNKGNPFYVMCADRSERVFQAFLNQVVLAAINVAITDDSHQAVVSAAMHRQLQAIARTSSSRDARLL